MNIKKPFVEIKKPPVYTGVNPQVITTDMLNEFLKNEIVKEKNCACPNCNTKRLYHRKLQEILAEYDMMKKN